MRVVLGVLAVLVLSPEDRMGCMGHTTPPESFDVSWSMPAGPGTRGVEYIGCSDWRIRRRTFLGVAGQAGWTSCGVRAWRQDGQLRVVSDVVPLSGATQQIDFELPEGPLGGLGIYITAHGRGGVLVRSLLRSSQAESRGLRPGMRIVAVDGVPTADLTQDAFVRQVVGAPGTSVRLTVRDPDMKRGVRSFDVERVRLP